MKICQVCSKELEIKLPVGRRDVCAFCGADLHCCRNCTFYVMGTYNDCREPQAERVIEKGQSNFCDYFVFLDSAVNDKEKDIRDITKEKLEGLFKKD